MERFIELCENIIIKIIDKMKISPTTLDKHIASLKERRLIYPAGPRGKYKLNMQIFST